MFGLTVVVCVAAAVVLDWTILVTSSTIPPSEGCTGDMNYIMAVDKKMRGSTTTTLRGKTELGCIDECWERQLSPNNCKSVYYDLLTSMCYLYNKDQWDDPIVSGKDYNYWEICSGCNSRKSYITKPFTFSVTCFATSTSWVVNMTCNPGWVFNDGSLATWKTESCDCDTENWPTSVNKCQQVRCPKWPKISNAIDADSGNRLGGTVTYSCLSPYSIISGDKTLVCDITGNWSGTVPVCGIPTTAKETTTAEPTTTIPETTVVTTTEVMTTTQALTTTIQPTTTVNPTTSEALTTTVELPTEAITTKALTTEAITTEAITTEAKTTEAITTEAITTEAITTGAITTEAISTKAITTKAITTKATTTDAITTEAITTKDVSTEAITTRAITTEHLTTPEAIAEALKSTTLPTETSMDDSTLIGVKTTESMIQMQAVTTTLEHSTAVAITTMKEPTTEATTEIHPCYGVPVAVNGQIRIATSDVSRDFHTVTVSCDSGYFLQDGTSNVTKYCADMWEDLDFYCQKYICPEPPVLKGRILLRSSRHEGGKAVYGCAEGFLFKDLTEEKSLTCDHMVWTGSIIRCRRIECPVFQPVHAMVDLNTKKYVVATVTCHVGYAFADGTHTRTVTCKKDGSWSVPPESLDCTVRQCTPVNKTGVTISYNQASLAVDTVYSATCVSEEEVFSQGTRELTGRCTSSGEWSGEEDKCRADSCPPPPYLPYSTVVRSGPNFTFTCLPGHKFEDGLYEKTIDCNEASDIVGRNPFKCLDIKCTATITVRNSQHNSTTAIYGTVVQYTCNYGYWFPDQEFVKILQCQSDGQWSNPAMPDCVETLCPHLNVYDNTTVSSLKRGVNSAVYFACKPKSLRFSDGKREKDVTCLPNGQWDDLISECAGDRCSQVPAVQHAVANTVFALYGTVVQYQCEAGYQFTDNVTAAYLKCSQDQQAWNDTVPDCTPVDCGRYEVDHGVVHSNLTSYGTTVGLSCENGYTLPHGTESVNITCGANKLWYSEAGLGIYCQALQCPQLLSDGTMYLNMSDFSYGTAVKVTCIDGYLLPDKTTQTVLYCGHRGNWSEPLPSCTESYCHSVPLWYNIITDTMETRHGVKVNYTCESGYYFMSTTRKLALTSKCSNDGTWQPPFEQCIEVNTSHVYIPKEAPMSKSIGIVAAVVVTITISAFLVLDAPSIMQDLGKMRQNLNCSHRRPKHVDRRYSYIPTDELRRNRKKTPT